jgi:hypothetical protein
MSRYVSFAPLARVGLVACLLSALSCGGKTPVAPATPAPPPPTTMPPPTTLADLSASVTSPENGHTFGCRDDVHFKATITNQGGTAVIVTGIKKHSSVVHGSCNSGGDFAYNVGVAAPAHATTVITDRPVYDNGSGCCGGASTCSGMCTFKQEFAVVTRLGDVPAGSFQYQVIFGNCGQCSSARAEGQEACRLPAR